MEQLTLDLWSGKMYPEHSAATKDRTLQPSSKKRSASSSRKPPILKCLTRDGLLGGGYRDVDGRWSVAWRTLDAQYWGVPQRRRRIALVADFGGCTASEILFERKSLSGDSAESRTKRKRSSGEIEDGAAYAVRIRGGCDGGGKGALIQTEKSGTLGTSNDQTVFCLQGNGIDRADTAGCNGKGWREDKSYTLNTVDRPAVAYSFDSLASNSMKSKNPHSGCSKNT